MRAARGSRRALQSLVIKLCQPFQLACRVTPQLTTSDFVSTDVSFTNVQSCLTLNVHLVRVH